VGKQQAKKLRDFFKDIQIDKIYTSQRKRTVQTAMPLCVVKKLVIEKDSRIAEIDLGSWEGKTSKQVKKMISKDISCEDVTSGGELYRDFQKRVRAFVKEVQTLPEKTTLVIVTHKGVIREIYKVLMKDKNLIVEQEYGAINYFVVDGGIVEEKIRNKVI
jgi:broad specificity phosphatase PhoE